MMFKSVDIEFQIYWQPNSPSLIASGPQRAAHMTSEKNPRHLAIPVGSKGTHSIITYCYKALL